MKSRNPKYIRHRVIVDGTEYSSLLAAWKILNINGKLAGHQKFRLELKDKKKITRFGHLWELGTEVEKKL